MSQNATHEKGVLNSSPAARRRHGESGKDMLTVAKVKYLREQTGNGLEEVKEALLKAEGDPWLAVGILHYKGLAVTLRKRLPDGSVRAATAEEAAAHWLEMARDYAESYRREQPGLADRIAAFEMDGKSRAGRLAAQQPR